MSTLMGTVRKFLSESPNMTEGGSDLSYWRSLAIRAKYDHLNNSETVAKTPEHHITLIHQPTIPGKYQEYNRQYLVRDGSGDVSYRADFKDHKFSSHPHLNGSYSSMVIKVNQKDRVSSITKQIYDHELQKHDYLISDSNQYEGGKHIWKHITKDYEESGKHLYLYDGDIHHKITHQEILDKEDYIWGNGDVFTGRRLVISHHPIEKS